MKTILTLAFAITAMVFTGSVQAQSCGCGGSAIGGVASYGGFGGYGGGFQSYGGGGFDSFAGTSFGSVGNYGNYGMIGPGGPNDCGRGYTNQQAASLWAGYCTESCVSKSGCGLFGKKCGGGGCGRRHTAARFGYPSGGCGGGGCSQGCFGYPSCCGCGSGGCSTGGCSTGGRRGCAVGGLLRRLLGKFHRGGAGSCSRCSLGGFRLFGGRHGGGGCGLLSRCKLRKTTYAAITTYPVSTVAVDQCGCGSSGQYFDYAVGHEYGTAGMQSSISGELTGACSSCGDVSTGFDMGGSMGYESTGGYESPGSYESPGFSAAPMVQQGLDLIQ